MGDEATGALSSWGTSQGATELGWEMLGGKRAKVGTFARAIIQFFFLAGLSSLFGAFPVHGEEPPELDLAVQSCGEPVDPDSPTCQNTTEEIQVCGKKENLTHLCSYPFVTDAMSAEAAKYPVLKDEYERHNACVSTDPDCKALDSVQGDDSLQTELNSYASDTIPDKIRFHLSATGRTVDAKFLGVRDDASLITKKGFERNIVMGHHLFRTLPNEKFHEDAEGVALANKGIVDKEREELEKQLVAFAEMKKHFQDTKDKISELNTEGYETIARNRSLQLSAVSCELKRMADKDRRIENRIAKVIVDGKELPKDKYGQGSPDAPSPNPHSDITGVDPNPPGLPDPGAPQLKIGAPSKAPIHLSPVENGGGLPVIPNTSGGSMPPPSYTGGTSDSVPTDDPLSAFGADPSQVGRTFRETASAPQGVKEEDDALFDRVHRQYRAREQSGNFRQSLVD